jgi:hypothetical protein
MMNDGLEATLGVEARDKLAAVNGTQKAHVNRFDIDVGFSVSMCQSAIIQLIPMTRFARLVNPTQNR